MNDIRVVLMIDTLWSIVILIQKKFYYNGIVLLQLQHSAWFVFETNHWDNSEMLLKQWVY